MLYGVKRDAIMASLWNWCGMVPNGVSDVAKKTKSLDLTQYRVAVKLAMEEASRSRWHFSYSSSVINWKHIKWPEVPFEQLSSLLSCACVFIAIGERQSDRKVCQWKWALKSALIDCHLHLQSNKSTRASVETNNTLTCTRILTHRTRQPPVTVASWNH